MLDFILFSATIFFQIYPNLQVLAAQKKAKESDTGDGLGSALAESLNPQVLAIFFAFSSIESFTNHKHIELSGVCACTRLALKT